MKELLRKREIIIRIAQMVGMADNPLRGRSTKTLFVNLTLVQRGKFHDIGVPVTFTRLPGSERDFKAILGISIDNRNYRVLVVQDKFRTAVGRGEVGVGCWHTNRAFKCPSQVDYRFELFTEGHEFHFVSDGNISWLADLLPIVRV